MPSMNRFGNLQRMCASAFRAYRAQRSRFSLAERGFTLLELMIVITIIMILLAIAGGRYEKSVTNAKEAALRQDLSVMRNAIDQFTLDKQAAPQSLEDLTSAGYLRAIPVDPITKQADWTTDSCDTLSSPDQTITGICDVHSPSPLTGLDGTQYSSW